ncbi:MAG: hypothetical protein ACREBG_14085 [Pyrinomonadaceae bacterium]
MRYLLIILMVVTSSGSAIAQTPVCSLTTFWVRHTPFSSSSRWLVGTFPLVLDDDDKPLRKMFHHDESGLDISVGVDTMKASLSPKDPTTILRVAFAFSNKPDDVFDATDSVYADSIYDKRWRMVSVSKSIAREDRIYTFTFGCERLPPKKRSH